MARTVRRRSSHLTSYASFTMAKTSAVWGIDIGNSSLKALRCRQSLTEPDKIEVVAFDFIEHSKILSQPGAEPAEIMAETLQTFLSRNSVHGDRVAISVSGQNTISRFLKLPPVDPKKIPDIIKYEARQWIPFDPQDVIWDFQPIGPPVSPTAVPLDSEVGMFAMKRDIAMKTLEPFIERGFNVDCIQSAPLALYNFVAFDQLRMQEKPDDFEYDPDNPPESVVLLCVGTDATDVVITNGYSIWIRSVPIGGNRFTQALTKGLKLTFSKAEYLKRNATAAQDPKAVFQAMRPVFNDMLSEVHRSIEYYQSLNRKAKFGKILALGNAMKMPGLRQFLTQNLGYEVVRVPGFEKLVGAETIDSPLFKDNLGSFAVAYGLALQELGEAPLTTNLVPKEIIVDRIVREKKPWVLAACAVILIGLTCQFIGAKMALDTVTEKVYGNAERQAKAVQDLSAKMKSGTTAAVTEFKRIDNIGVNLTSKVEGRITWLEVLRAINEALPKERDRIDGKKADEIAEQERLFITSIEAVNSDDLARWFATLKDHELYTPDEDEIRAAMAVKGTTGSPPIKLSEQLKLVDGPPAGTSGKIIQLVGYHYRNFDKADGRAYGDEYVRKTLIHNLKYKDVKLPAALEKQDEDSAQTVEDTVPIRKLGLMYPTLVYRPRVVETEAVNPAVLLEEYKRQRREQLERRSGVGGPRSSSGGFGGGFGGSGGGTSRREAHNPLQTGLHLGVGDLTSLFANTGGNTLGSRNINSIEQIAKDIGEDDKISLRKFDFVIQIGWKETPPSEREEIRREEQEKLAGTSAGAVPEAASQGAASTTPSTTPPTETPPTETPMSETVSPIDTSDTTDSASSEDTTPDT